MWKWNSFVYCWSIFQNIPFYLLSHSLLPLWFHHNNLNQIHARSFVRISSTNTINKHSQNSIMILVKPLMVRHKLHTPMEYPLFLYEWNPFIMNTTDPYKIILISLPLDWIYLVSASNVTITHFNCQDQKCNIKSCMNLWLLLSVICPVTNTV